MLSKKYISLHENLGLGPIWINKNFSIIKNNNMEETHIIEKTNNNKTINNIVVNNNDITKINQKDISINNNIEIIKLKMHIYFMRTKSIENEENILWITTKPNEFHHKTNDYHKINNLLEQIIKSICYYEKWENIENHSITNWEYSLDSFIKNHQKIIFMSKDIFKINYFNAIIKNESIKTLIIPHPNTIIRNPELKKNIWSKLLSFNISN